MLAPLLLALPYLAPVQTTGSEIVGKCYMKPDMKAAGDSYREDPEEEVSSPSACAELCSKKTRCNSFSFLQGEGNSGTCSFRKDQELRSRPDKGYTGGWCPKGALVQEPWWEWVRRNGSAFSSKPAPLNCTSTGHICQFPFMINYEVHWDCVPNEEGIAVCPTEESKIPKNFKSLHSFLPCKGNCVIPPADYKGYSLVHEEKETFYGVSTKEECQALCQLAENCSYFVFTKGGATSCILKNGVGVKEEEGSGVFGPKVYKGDCNGITLAGGECMVSCRAAGSPHHLNIPAAHLGQNCDNITGGFGSAGIAGVTLVILVLLLIAIGLVYMWKKKKTETENQNEESGPEMHALNTQTVTESTNPVI